MTVSDPGKSFLGHFNDGQTAASHEVQIRFGPDGLLFGPERAPAQHHWAYDNVRAVKPMGKSGPAWLSYRGNDDARLIVGSPEFASGLLPRASQVGTAAGHRKTVAIAALCLGGLAIVGGLIWILMALVPGAIAKSVPESWWLTAGANIERTLVKGAMQCHGREGKEALARLSFKFSDDVEANTIRVYDMKIVNAFAMAGGHVVISKKLIEKAGSPEEVAGVLAHELGHVKARHPETQLVRVLGLQLILSALWGGSGVGDILAQGGAMLSILSYTRDAEREADDLAIELMRKAKIDPRGLASFFESISSAPAAASSKKGLGWGSMLSTHPGMGERIEKIKKLETGETEPALSADDWRALRAICG